MNKTLGGIVGIGVVDYDSNAKSDNYYGPSCRNAIKSAIKSAGLGALNPEIPLLDIIKPGTVVLIKPNWVNHINFNPKFDSTCLYTHREFIENVISEVASCNPGKIILGDAPIQGCEFDSIAPEEWHKKIQDKYTFPVVLIDFRSTILKKDQTKNELPIIKENGSRKTEDYILFDLGHSSSLENISGTHNYFRVAMYDHEKLNKRHGVGIHQYLIAKEIFEADVIINLPKLKTHKKAGMTGALKNLVGINGNKDYLPHHRVGGTGMGGDNYSGFSILKRITEFFIDKANSHIGKRRYPLFKRISEYCSSLAGKIGSKTDYEGGWYGNDTTWRMVLDINRIVLFGNQNGDMNPKALRKVFSITDAIIAGDTEGPLSVEPVYLGLVTFSASSGMADLVHATLMHFDWHKIPCIRESFNQMNFPLNKTNPENCRVIVDGKEIQIDELAKKYGKPFRPAKHWKGHIELE